MSDEVDCRPGWSRLQILAGHPGSPYGCLPAAVFVAVDAENEEQVLRRETADRDAEQRHGLSAPP